MTIYTIGLATIKLTTPKQKSELLQKVENWLGAHVGEEFSSPRDEKIGKTKKFRIIGIVSEKLKIRFEGSKYDALPLYFWMFERTIGYLLENKDKCICLGAKLKPPYYINSIEGQIWQKPYPTGNSSYKASPHICDILELAGVAEYTNCVNPATNRTVQAIKLLNQD